MQTGERKLSDYLELCKLRISLVASFSAAAGFLSAQPYELKKIVFLWCGVFMLACGASSLNQFQERHTDAFMPRTKNRPIPSGKIRPGHALFFSISLVIIGVTILYSGCKPAAALLGYAAVFWYNGVYTYLKRVTAFAAIPGALTGALPPAIGWVAAGGSPLEPALLAICLFFAIWQVPHFWLFLITHGKEYESAGLPSISNIFRRPQLVRIIFHWIAATAASGLMLVLFGLAKSGVIRYSLLAASGWLIIQGFRFILNNGDECQALFRRINLYMAAVLLLISTDSLSGLIGVRNTYLIIASSVMNYCINN